MSNLFIKYYCDECNEENETKIKQEEKIFTVKDTQVKAVIETRYCCKCGQAVWDEELEKKNEKIVFNEYRAQKHFLLPEQIKEIRETIGISQSAFSRLLGFGEKTITRYESGAPQDSAHNLLICFMKDKKNVKIAFNKNESLLTTREKRQVKEYLDKSNIDLLQLPENAKILKSVTLHNTSPYYNYMWREIENYG